MEAEFINLTEKNIDSEHLCCIIRSKKPHPGAVHRGVFSGTGKGAAVRF